MRSFIVAATQDPAIGTAFSTFRADEPQLFVDVDRIKAKNQKIPLNQVFGTMATQLGSNYVNDFNLEGKTYQVKVQADQTWRDDQKKDRSFPCAKFEGDMVPLGTFMNVRSEFGPDVLNRYNLYNSVTVNGQPGPGFASGQSIDAMARVSSEVLPEGYQFEWTGMTYQEIKAGKRCANPIRLGAHFRLFLPRRPVLESWTIPIAVLMGVPLSLLGPS